jgi:hypothetical protein
VLELRVSGGACVPEQQCLLWIWVGTPPASIEIETNASVTTHTGGAFPAGETEGIVRLSVVTHGPEANLRLVARRDGQIVARRAYRLPVALGATTLRLQTLIHDSGEPVVFRLEDTDEQAGCIVNGFRDDRWLLTGSSTDCRNDAPLPFPLSDSGVWRLQARRDPYGASTSAARLFYVRPAGEDDAETLAAIARYANAHQPEDDFARRVAARPEVFAEHGVERAAAFLLASLEREVIAQPEPVASYPQAQKKLRRQRALVRNLCLAALASAGLALVFLIARRGLSAASRARQILARAGDRTAQSPRKRLLMTLTVLSAVISMALAFVAIALYVIARGGAP